MSRNGNRWYVFGREVPLADGRIVAIPPGTVYEFAGWSRTKEAATARRDKLDRAGRQGIMVFSATRQTAMADVMEVYPGVVVKGYISPANKRAGRAIVRAAVMRHIFCPFTGVVMDMRRAVVVDTGTRAFVMSGAHWDKVNAEHDGLVAEVTARNGGRPVTIYDGRELFKR